MTQKTLSSHTICVLNLLCGYRLQGSASTRLTLQRRNTRLPQMDGYAASLSLETLHVLAPEGYAQGRYRYGVPGGRSYLLGPNDHTREVRHAEQIAQHLLETSYPEAREELLNSFGQGEEVWVDVHPFQQHARFLRDLGHRVFPGINGNVLLRLGTSTKDTEEHRVEMYLLRGQPTVPERVDPDEQALDELTRDVGGRLALNRMCTRLKKAGSGTERDVTLRFHLQASGGSG